jgi:serine/threonine protein kinase
MLADAGFFVPMVLAVGRSARNSSGPCFFLATQEVTDARPVYKYLVPSKVPEPACSLPERRELLRSMGQTIGRMHRAGIVHGDLRPGNILARKGKGGWEFFFIDNERTRMHHVLWPSLRRKNLVQINMLPQGLSRTDRMRFFQAYMLMNPSVCGASKTWARRIMRVTQHRFQNKGWVPKP